MKLKYNIETVEIDDDIIAVPIGDDADKIHGIIKCNQEAKIILDYLKSDISQNEIVKKLAEVYENDIESLTKYVNNFISRLRDMKLIDD